MPQPVSAAAPASSNKLCGCLLLQQPLLLLNSLQLKLVLLDPLRPRVIKAVQHPVPALEGNSHRHKAAAKLDELSNSALQTDPSALGGHRTSKSVRSRLKKCAYCLQRKLVPGRRRCRRFGHHHCCQSGHALRCLRSSPQRLCRSEKAGSEAQQARGAWVVLGRAGTGWEPEAAQIIAARTGVKQRLPWLPAAQQIWFMRKGRRLPAGPHGKSRHSTDGCL